MTERENRFEALVGQLRSLIEESVSAEVARQHALAEAAAKLTSGDLTDLIIGARRIRDRHFTPKLFGEPGWDILLGLHSAHHRDIAVTVGAAVTFGDTPASTGLRWLAELEREKLVERREDFDDQRRTFVGLTQEAVEKMDRFTGAFADWVATNTVMRKK